MSKFFYIKLSISNLRKNGKLYYPYLLATIVNVAMFYIMVALTSDEGLNTIPGATSLKMIMMLGCIVIAIFSIIFLFYINSFLMKHRKKEMGLYNILGMEKKHIGRILFFETLETSIIGIFGGILAGFVFYELVLLILYRFMGIHASFSFQLSGMGLNITLLLFLGIFFIIYIADYIQLKVLKPIELLHSGSIGEKEPRSKWLLALMGFVCLGTGYYIAITTESPLTAMVIFFIAVLLVIVGTYCLFTAGSIVLLKLLRKHKSYYYKTNHFTSISGMLYRMKQNAVGLANICILSTMVLVMVSSTVSLYLGIQDCMNYRYPSDLFIASSAQEVNSDFHIELLNSIKKTVKEEGREIKQLKEHEYLNFAVIQKGREFMLNKEDNSNGMADCTVSLCTLNVYNKLTGKKLPELKKDEIYLETVSEKRDQIVLAGKPLKVKEMVNSGLIKGEDSAFLVNMYYIIVKDATVMEEFFQIQKQEYKEDAGDYMYSLSMDIDGTKEEKIACGAALEEMKAQELPMENGYTIRRVECKEKEVDSFYVIFGGFLFLGIFLGFLFLVVTALLIYYKQISEGYDDKERFTIMLNVGMSQKEVKACIHSQIIKIFFLPVLVAVIHVAAAFPLITKLLGLLQLHNIALTLGCTIATILVFLLAYSVMYLVTTRTYYKIIRQN
ncbi:MAG: ABC transporter permease [Lachnospiraceae bacterium]